MSGLVALVRLDGRPVAETDLRRMCARIAHRGPATLWLHEGVGLAQLHAGSGGLSVAALPAPVGVAGRIVCVGDVRLDERGSLVRALALDGTRPCDLTLVAAAYERWGERWTERVVGDFAVAIWDRRSRALHWARDHLGARPLFQHVAAGRFVAVASETRAMWGCGEIRREPDERRIADYLGGVYHEATRTFFEGVDRVPAGHRRVAADGRVVGARYWSPHDVPVRSPVTEDDCLDEFRAHFLRAVRDRIPDRGLVGSHLSGGVDSSSVTCAAHHVLGPGADRLRTYSALFVDDARCDERAHIDSVRLRCPVAGRELFDRELAPHRVLEDELVRQDEPFWSPMLLAFSRLYRVAAADGVGVMLDGFDGDAVAHQSYQRLLELFDTMRWRALLGEVRGVAESLDASPRSVLRRYVVRPSVPDPLRWAWRTVRRRPGPIDIVSDDLSRRVGLPGARARDAARDFARPRGAREGHRLRVGSGVMAFTLGTLDTAARAAGVEARHPFFDVRLVRYALSLPSEWKFRRGWTRYPLRAALAGIVPDTVRWRADKAGQVGYFVRQMATGAANDVEAALSTLPGWVDTHRVRAVRRRFLRHGASDDAVLLWRLQSVHRWYQAVYTSSEPSPTSVPPNRRAP